MVFSLSVLSINISSIGRKESNFQLNKFFVWPNTGNSLLTEVINPMVIYTFFPFLTTGLEQISSNVNNRSPQIKSSLMGSKCKIGS
jgi:hypothetical protein